MIRPYDVTKGRPSKDIGRHRTNSKTRLSTSKHAYMHVCTYMESDLQIIVDH